MRTISQNMAHKPGKSFGSPLVERSYEADTLAGYRFGMNTQEKDDEIYGKGNATSSDNWEYDTRLGRRFNIDPLFKKFPQKSPYMCFDNNPICLIDNGGDSTAYYTASGKFLGMGSDNFPDAIVIIKEEYFNILMAKIASTANPNEPAPTINDHWVAYRLRSLGKLYEVKIFRDLYKGSMAKDNECKGITSKDGMTKTIFTDKNGNPLHNEVEINLQDIGGKIVQLGQPTKGSPYGNSGDKGKEGTVATAHSHPNAGIDAIIKTIKTIITVFGERTVYEIDKTKGVHGPSGGPNDPEFGDIDNSQAKPGYLSVVAEKNVLYFYDSMDTRIIFKNFKNASNK